MPGAELDLAAEEADPAQGRGRGWGWLVALGGTLLLVAITTKSVDFQRTWGWDESMHAELPAARMAELVRAGEWRAAVDVLLACDRYPFVVPVYLAAVQLVAGVGEAAARYALAYLWCAGVLVMVGVLARALETRARTSAWCYLLGMLAALAPVARLFAPTLFLEAPFAAALALALYAWLGRRAGAGGRARDLAAGACLALAFFTKFNYGLLLALALALDATAELVGAARRGAPRRTLASLARVWAVPLLAAAWWFLLPLPGGPELGASHREAFASFLAGNRELPRVAWSLRLLDWSTLVFPPALGALLAACVLASLRLLARPGIRCLWLVAATFAAALWAHPFHLDRFLLPAAVPLWALAIAGLGALDAAARRRPRPAIAILLGAVPVSLAAGWWWTANALGVLGLANVDPALASYQQEQLEQRTHRYHRKPLPTAGLLRDEAERFLDLAALGAGPTARVAWIGMSSELSPAMVHLGLFARGGSVERFLRDAHQPMDVTYEGVDPGWTKEELAAFLRGFEVVFVTDPPDVGRRATRAFLAEYRRMLIEGLGWREAELGTIEVQKGLGTYPVRLFVCRP